MKQWYEILFENYAKSYDRESFTSGTSGECEFIEKEAAFNKKIKILDIGCGTGRHSIELARRGYHVTGIDLSETMLAHAKKKASGEGIKVSFLKYDARELPFDNDFDLAIMICEGSFPLMETDEMNFRILQNAARAIRKGGKLIFTTLNGLFPLFHSVRDFYENVHLDGNAEYKDNTFDLLTFRDHNITIFTDDSGVKQELRSNERFYVPPEITWLCKSAGFTKVDIYGAKLGAFSRKDMLTIDDFEMLVIAEKN